MGHFKKDCLKRKAWFDKKVTHYPIRGAKQYLFIGSMMKARIEDIGTYRLIFDTGCHIDLEECLYVPDGLDNLGFIVKFGHDCFSFYRNDYFYDSGTLFDSLYRFILDVKFFKSLFNIEIQGITHSASNENSAFLWHQRLGHISKDMMMRLVKNEILPHLNFSDLDVVRSDRVGQFYGKFNKNGQCPGPFANLLESKETGDARLIENGQTSGSNVPQKVDIVIPIVLSQSNDTIEQPNDVQMPQVESLVDEHVTIQEENSIPHEPFRRSISERRSVIPDDYVVYAVEITPNQSIIGGYLNAPKVYTHKFLKNYT
ncbi:hypothetical protein V2J09_016374 [Rumex salicifolius]